MNRSSRQQLTRRWAPDSLGSSRPFHLDVLRRSAKWTGCGVRGGTRNRRDCTLMWMACGLQRSRNPLTRVAFPFSVGRGRGLRSTRFCPIDSLAFTGVMHIISSVTKRTQHDGALMLWSSRFLPVRVHWPHAIIHFGRVGFTPHVGSAGPGSSVPRMPGAVLRGAMAEIAAGTDSEAA